MLAELVARPYCLFRCNKICLNKKKKKKKKKKRKSAFEHAEDAHSYHPAHAQSVTRVFAFQLYILWYPMIILVDGHHENMPI